MIEIRHADKYFNKNKTNEIHVINDISLSLPKSGMVAVFGRSGCGKTTLLNCIGGLDSISSGSVEIDGNTLTPSADAIRNKYIGYIFQNYNLNTNETCYENVADALLLCGMTDPEEIDRRVMSALKNVDMEKYKKRTPDTLSGGQQQRIAIARAIVKNPEIILADEPTGNLDEENTVKVMNLLKAFSKDHLVILVTHEANLVDYYCDKVIELSDGKFVGEKNNQDANGFAARSKNDIYLGEFNRQESRTGNIVLEYYGEPSEEIRLRIVNAGGKLYLESLNSSVRFLDASSEIKLRQGKYSEEQTKETAEAALDLSALTPVEGTVYGRLYTLKTAFKAALTSIFSGQKKKSTKMIRFSLFAMAFILVFLTASSGKNLRKYFDTKKSSSPDILYIPTDANELFGSDIDLSYLLPSNENKIDFAYRVYASENFTSYTMSIEQANFSSVEVFSVSDSTNIYDSKLLAGLTAVAGTKEISSGKEVVISTFVADEIIKNSTYSFINSYDDLIGLPGKDRKSEQNYTIAGIVKSSDNAVFMDKSLYIQIFLDQSGYYFGDYTGVYPASRFKDILGDYTVEPGTYITLSFVGAEEDKNADEDDVAALEKPVIKPGTNQPEHDILYVNDRKFEWAKNFDTTDWDAIIANPTVIISDYDYEMLQFYSGYSGFEKDYFADSYYSSRTDYILVHTSDINATKAFLESKGLTGVLTPKDVIEKRLDNDLRPFIRTAIVMGVITAVMCVSLFFIMRSSMLTRIREIGINRAIGVSKKNICFRFLVESFVLTVITIVLGFAVATFFVSLLTKGTLLANALFLPPVIAILLLVILLAASLLAGVLPVIFLLGKTPSEILAKYDI